MRSFRPLNIYVPHIKFLVSLFAMLVINATKCALAQISFPKGFKQIKGELGSGLDDVYSNGRYAFSTRREFLAYDEYKTNDAKFKMYVSNAYGFPFFQTKDSLLWGTGKSDDGIFYYVVVDWGGEAYILHSYFNDSGFSYYSKWLIMSIREYRKKGKLFVFPLH